MDINRLLKYAKLLAKGAVEAQIVISENYAAKSEIIKSIKQDSFRLSQSRTELVELIEKDKKIFERVKRWVESKESNTALKMLEEGMDIQLPVNLNKKVAKIIDFNKRDHKILMKLGKLLDEQEKLVKEKIQPTRFVKMFEKLLKKQHKYFEELNYYGTQSAKNFNKFFGNLKPYLSHAGDITVILGSIGLWDFISTKGEKGLEIVLGNVLM